MATSATPRNRPGRDLGSSLTALTVGTDRPKKQDQSSAPNAAADHGAGNIPFQAHNQPTSNPAACCGEQASDHSSRPSMGGMVGFTPRRMSPKPSGCHVLRQPRTRAKKNVIYAGACSVTEDVVARADDPRVIRPAASGSGKPSRAMPTWAMRNRSKTSLVRRPASHDHLRRTGSRRSRRGGRVLVRTGRRNLCSTKNLQATKIVAA